MNKLLVSISLFLLLFQITPVHAESAQDEEEMLVRYPAYRIKELSYAQLQKYKQELLRLALLKSGRRFSMERVDIDVITSDRNMRNLAQGVYDVNWMHTSIKREQELIPIRIPVYKGLIGWRILLIHKDLQQDMRTLSSLEGLKQIKMGQAFDWPDTEVLQAHEFNLVLASNAQTLMNMLKGHRIDAFPRSMVEIWDEFELHGDSNVVIDTNIALVYPTAFYTFVDKRRPELAVAIERGMEEAVKDGSYDKLFDRYFSEVIRRADLHKRRIFYLDNPELSGKTPLHRPELWFNLEGESKE